MHNDTLNTNALSSFSISKPYFFPQSSSYLYFIRHLSQAPSFVGNYDEPGFELLYRVLKRCRKWRQACSICWTSWPFPSLEVQGSRNYMSNINCKFFFRFWAREDGGDEREILDFAHELLASTANSECSQ